MTPSSMRLTLFLLMSAAWCAAQTSTAPATRPDADAKVILSYSFDDGKGLGERFARNFHPSDPAICTVALERPAGEGNDSTSTLASRMKALDKLPAYVGVELPVHNTPCEPEGWDGAVSLRFFNGGFDTFYVLYLPIWPSDVTFHRAYFKAPKGQWTRVELPMDQFLYHGRRPRRGTNMEYFTIVAEGPENRQAYFQFDDFTYAETPRKDAPASKPKAALPEGVIYRQDFDDAADLDIESYYPTTANCNAFRADRASGEPGGCLRIQLYKPGDSFRAGRRFKPFPAKDVVVEFDVLASDADDFGLFARTQSNKRFRQYARPQPQPGRWTHCIFRADELIEQSQLATPQAAATRPAAGETLFEVTFHAHPTDPKAYILIDNLVVRRVPISP